MPRICYEDRNFAPRSLELIEQANEIITEYAEQGFDLTLRQLYYQFVARDLIPNRQAEYKKLGSVINDARLAGLIDWDAIVDRTRFLRSLAHWDDESDIVETCSQQFRIDRWANQENRVEVWIEKDALVGVIEPVCKSLDVPYFSCRGYTSQSEMWSAAQRLIKHAENGQVPRILHLGDHDPSGIDMSRDIKARIRMFMRHHDVVPARFKRLALNMDQVEEHNPPPNPAKITDSRAAAYIDEFGHESWELDALNPTTLSELIREAIVEEMDVDQWEADVRRETEAKTVLAFAAENWTRVRALYEEEA